MLQRWFNRTRCTGVGACSIVAVSATRSASGSAVLGVNVDQPLFSAPPRIATTVSDGIVTLAANDHVFVGRNDEGIAVAVVVRREYRRSTAARLGRMLLPGRQRINQIGDAVQQHWCGSATIVAADGSDVRGWNIEDGATRLLSAHGGLLIVSAGHSNGDPLPGGGWTIEKLARLESMKRVAVDDVRRSLEVVRLGGRTSRTIVLEPTCGHPLVRDDDFGPLRRSA